jgi:hypothetical protein
MKSYMISPSAPLATLSGRFYYSKLYPLFELLWVAWRYPAHKTTNPHFASITRAQSSSPSLGINRQGSSSQAHANMSRPVILYKTVAFLYSSGIMHPSFSRLWFNMLYYQLPEFFQGYLPVRMQRWYMLSGLDE